MDEIEKLALLGLIFGVGVLLYSFTLEYEQDQVLTKNTEPVDYIINE